MIREDNKPLEKTVVYSYDDNGNILSQRRFAFSLKDSKLIEEAEAVEEKTYSYVGDQVIAINEENFAYDAIGNPTIYRGKTAGWIRGRVMTNYDGNSFTYDSQNRRITKNTTTYYYDNIGRMLKQIDSADSTKALEFFYDNTGVFSVKQGNTTYFYRKDVLGNIVALLDSNGSVIVKYTYDGWGNHVVTDQNGVVIESASHIGNVNPFK